MQQTSLICLAILHLATQTGQHIPSACLVHWGKLWSGDTGVGGMAALAACKPPEQGKPWSCLLVSDTF
jgi:hypothetical protein